MILFFVKNKKLKGLTLIELLVSIAIIAFITAIFVTNYTSSNKRTDLIMASQVMVADIHQAQNNTLGLVKYDGDSPAGGWGIHFNMSNPNQYIIFADLQEPGDSGSLSFDSATEGDETHGAVVVELPPGISLDYIKTSDISLPGSLNYANIVFLPPDPLTNIYSSAGSTSTQIYIGLREIKSNSTKVIYTNFLGLSEVLD